MTGPLPYHRAVVGRLRVDEPAAWTAFRDTVGGPAAEQVHAELVRTAYRLDPAAHPDVAAAAARAAAALGVDVPVTVYQLEGGSAGTDGGAGNAHLVHVPAEAVVVFAGPLLSLLSADELTAVLGHELAHHALWTQDSGDLLVADRLLDAAALDARSPATHLETARRWSLATELAADRGGLLACGDLRTAVAALVRTTTGLAAADPESFLAQAREAAGDAAAARGRSHPETVLRAWALEEWSRDRDAGDAAAAQVLGRSGPLDLDALDLLDRERLERLTRALVEAVLVPPGMRTDAVLAHARLFFPDLPDVPVAPTDGEAVVPPGSADATRRYLAYVLLDLATVDPDLEDGGLLQALRVAAGAGLGDVLADVAARERVRPAPDLARLARMAAEPVTVPAGTP